MASVRITDDALAAQLLVVDAFEQHAKAYYQSCGEDKAEADQALVAARQAGCLRSVLERWIVVRARTAQRQKQRIA